MAIGDKHHLGDTSFYETLHGPLIWGTCVDCKEPVLVVGPTDRINAHGLKEDTGVPDPRCSACGRKHHGVTS